MMMQHSFPISFTRLSNKCYLLLIALSVVSCSESHSNTTSTDEVQLDTLTIVKSTQSILPIISHDKISVQAVVSPDSSFAIDMIIAEGVVEAFTLIRPDINYYYPVVLPDDIIGGVDYTHEIWENDSLLVLPNIGGTGTGYYQMTINHFGEYSFRLVTQEN